MAQLFVVFAIAKVAKLIFETILSKLNKSWYENSEKQAEICQRLNIEESSFQKTLSYTRDKQRFAFINNWFSLIVVLVFIGFGGFGILENFAKSMSSSFQNNLFSVSANNQPFLTGLFFFFGLMILSTIASLPFEYYSTFYIEEKHGFNKQTPKMFFVDLIKGLLINVILGGLLIGILLKAMELGQYWWVWAWVFMSLFSLITSWIYPTVLAPLFNKFSPIEEGDLKKKIFLLAKKVNFETSGIFIMDASTRSTHGNAYFTGVMGKKRIVLFDTLIKNLSNNEIIAVLAHELGHFKLKHIRGSLIRGIFFTGFLFYLLSLCLPMESFYLAFGFESISNYAALVIFPLWFSLVSFLLSPMMSFMSRKNEFAADKFAVETVKNSRDLGKALISLSKSNHSMPLAHPLYSLFYYSHPPIAERLDAIKFSDEV